MHSNDITRRVKHLAIAWALLLFYCRSIPAGWYRRAPFLPLPPRDYVAWRLHTAYGGHHASWRALLRDLWQFGDWLRQYK